MIPANWRWAKGESTKMVSTGLCSLRAPPLASSCVPDQKPACRPKLLNKPIGLLHRRLGCVSVGSLCSALGVVACPEPSLQLPWSCGTQDCKPLWPSEPSNLGMFLWDSCKTQALSLQTGVPDTEISPRGDTLEHRRGREKKHPPSEVSGEALRQPLDAV